MTDRRRCFLPLFQNNQVLFGHDPKPGLIACGVQGGNQVKLYLRGDGEIRSELEPFEPMLLLEEENCLKGWRGEAKIVKLEGAGASR